MCQVEFKIKQCVEKWQQHVRGVRHPSVTLNQRHVDGHRSLEDDEDR